MTYAFLFETNFLLLLLNNINLWR